MRYSVLRHGGVDKIEIHAQRDIKSPAVAAQAGVSDALIGPVCLIGGRRCLCGVAHHADGLTRLAQAFAEGLERALDGEQTLPIFPARAGKCGDVRTLHGIHDLHRGYADVDSVAMLDFHNAHADEGEREIHAGAADQRQVAVFDLDGRPNAYLRRPLIGRRLVEIHSGENIGISVIAGNLLAVRQLLRLQEPVGDEAQIELIPRLGQNPGHRLLHPDRFTLFVKNEFAVFVRFHHALGGFDEIQMRGRGHVAAFHAKAVHGVINVFEHVVGVIDHELHRDRVLRFAPLNDGAFLAGHGVAVLSGLDFDGHVRALARNDRDIGVILHLISAVAHLPRDLDVVKNGGIHRTDAAGELGGDVQEVVRHSVIVAERFRAVLIGEEGHVVDLDDAVAGINRGVKRNRGECPLPETFGITAA